MTKAVLSFLPGYIFDGHRVVSSGAALSPTQHVDRKTGEILYYVRPFFEYGATIGLFVRHQGIVDYLRALEQDGSNP
mgnify:CR=1 FL=1